MHAKEAFLAQAGLQRAVLEACSAISHPAAAAGACWRAGVEATPARLVVVAGRVCGFDRSKLRFGLYSPSIGQPACRRVQLARQADTIPFHAIALRRRTRGTSPP
jgi:hypothetical protein